MGGQYPEGTPVATKGHQAKVVQREKRHQVFDGFWVDGVIGVARCRKSAGKKNPAVMGYSPGWIALESG